MTEAASWLPSAEELSVLFLSLRVSLVAALASVIPGVALAWLLARKQFPAKTVVELVVHLPLVLPPVVIGYLLLVVLGRRGIVGRFLHDQVGLDVAFTWRAAAIASAVMGFPLLVRAARLAIESVDTGLEQAARTLGAPPPRVLFTITLPLAAPGILAGVVLAFARSLGEFGATITFAGNIAGSTRTLPVAIYSLTQTPNNDAAALRLILISVAIALLALISSELLALRLRARGARP